MTIEFSAHLSEEAMNDVLIGLGSPESETHLAACARCRAQMEGFNSDMELFNSTTLAWSETRCATMPSPMVAPKRHLGLFAPVGMALAATLLVAIGAVAWNHNSEPSKKIAVARVATGQDDSAQIAADNELMRSVDLALSAGEESPLGELRMMARPHQRLKTRTGHLPDATSELRKQ